MTKKQFEAIAQSLWQVRPERLTETSKTTESEAWRQWKNTVGNLAETLSRFNNARFDPDTFMTDCGLERD